MHVWSMINDHQDKTVLNENQTKLPHFTEELSLSGKTAMCTVWLRMMALLSQVAKTRVFTCIACPKLPSIAIAHQMLMLPRESFHMVVQFTMWRNYQSVDENIKYFVFVLCVLYFFLLLYFFFVFCICIYILYFVLVLCILYVLFCICIMFVFVFCISIYDAVELSVCGWIVSALTPIESATSAALAFMVTPRDPIWKGVQSNILQSVPRQLRLITSI